MIQIIKFLIFGHIHKWKEVERVPCHGTGGDKWHRVYCVCEKCGLPKYFD